VLIEIEILRFDSSRGTFKALRDLVAIEDIVSLYVNDNLYTTFHCTPFKIEDLALGRLITDGLIEGVREVLEVRVSGRDVYVSLLGVKAANIMEKPRLIAAILRGAPPERILRLSQRIKSNDLKFSADAIFKAANVLNTLAKVFRASGGTHAAALISDNCEAVAFAEDIGRHNAVDKVVGEAAAKGVDFCRLILASTGRLTSEIVLKAAWIGVPVIVSLSAPTSMGIKLAEALGLTLVGFVKGGRFNIYTSLDRIIS